MKYEKNLIKKLTRNNSDNFVRIDNTIYYPLLVAFTHNISANSTQWGKMSPRRKVEGGVNRWQTV